MALGLLPVKTPGTSMPMVRVKAVGSITITRGDPLEIVGASGLVQPISAATDTIYGVAAETVATTTASQEIHMWPAIPGTVYEARAAGTPTQAQIGDYVDFSVFTTAAQVVDTSATTQGQLHFIGPRDFDSAFAASQDILVTIAATHNQWEGQ